MFVGLDVVGLVEEYYISVLLNCKYLICLFYEVGSLPVQRKLYQNFLRNIIINYFNIYFVLI